jgi:3-oxocholest-4-en-26-oyl-CoA dehydrogenase beta subunit
MDWSLTEEQQELQQLARTILEGEDRDRWHELAKANLLGLCLPEDAGGSGYGMVELAVILHEVGRAAAHLPVLPTVTTAMFLAERGSQADRDRWLPAVAAGEAVLSAAISEDPVLVPYGRQAAAIVIGDEVVPAEHLALDDVQTTSGEPQVTVTGLEGKPMPTWLAERWTAGLCAVQVGACERALEITAEYVRGREQFGKPIASFQAVAQRAADAYIDTEAIRLATTSAVWRLAEGLPATSEVAVAKFWAAEGGQRVLHACQHLHGGIGVDMDYPLHRYFQLTKQIELTLGSATPQLARLGRAIAAEPV